MEAVTCFGHFDDTEIKCTLECNWINSCKEVKRIRIAVEIDLLSKKNNIHTELQNAPTIIMPDEQ